MGVLGGGVVAESLPTVAASGDHLATLEALRGVLAEAIVLSDSARDVAALSARLTEVLAAIEKVRGQAPAAVSAVDQIAERRARRKPIRDGAARS
jgi:hypothetical protein